METDNKIDLELCMGSACFARGNRASAMAIENFVKEHGLEDQVQVRGALCENRCRTGPNAKINGEPCICKEGEIPTAILNLANDKRKP